MNKLQSLTDYFCRWKIATTLDVMNTINTTSPSKYVSMLRQRGIIENGEKFGKYEMYNLAVDVDKVDREKCVLID